jgi:hypothetical protein
VHIPQQHLAHPGSNVSKIRNSSVLCTLGFAKRVMCAFVLEVS